MIECGPPYALADAGPDHDRVLAGFVDRTLGPVLTAFGRWCAEEATILAGEPEVFGVEREGRLLARMAEPFGVTSTPLHLSRRVGLLAALGSVDEDGLANLLVRARARPATNIEACALLNIDQQASESPTEPVAVDELFRRLQSTGEIGAVRETSQRARTGLLTYLQSMGVAWDDRPLVLVDLGYAGNIQRTLLECLRLEGIAKPVMGLYLVTSPGIAWVRRSGGWASGFLADTGQPEDFMRRFLTCREVWELATGTPCGTTLGYESGRPLLAHSPYRSSQVTEMLRTQALCQSFAELAAAENETLPSAEACRRIALKFLEAPSPAEAAVIGGWLYDGDAGFPSRGLAEAGPVLADGRAFYWHAAAAALHA